MARFRKGKQTFVFEKPPYIVSTGAVGGKRESEGPLAAAFDMTSKDTHFGESSWEKAETRIQVLALEAALKKINLQTGDIDLVFAGENNNPDAPIKIVFAEKMDNVIVRATDNIELIQE